jgi:hypothetical protein
MPEVSLTDGVAGQSAAFDPLVQLPEMNRPSNGQEREHGDEEVNHQGCKQEEQSRKIIGPQVLPCRGKDRGDRNECDEKGRTQERAER